MPKLLGPEKQINLRLEITLNTALRESLAAGDFIQSIHGRIFVQYDQDESEQTAGYVNASLLQFADALEHGVSPDQLGDGISGDIAEYWELLFGPDTGRWKDELQTEFDIDRTDLLVIDCIEVQHKLRGHIGRKQASGQLVTAGFTFMSTSQRKGYPHAKTRKQ